MLTIRERSSGKRGAGEAAGFASEEPKTAAAQIKAEIGRRIRQARLRHGISTEDLAVAARIHPSFLSYVERGRKTPSLATIVDLAGALGLPLSGLFRMAPPKQSSGERSLGGFAGLVAGSTRKEKALYCEIVNGYVALVRKKTVEQRARILEGAAAVIYGLRHRK